MDERDETAFRGVRHGAVIAGHEAIERARLLDESPFESGDRPGQMVCRDRSWFECTLEQLNVPPDAFELRRDFLQYFDFLVAVPAHLFAILDRTERLQLE